MDDLLGRILAQIVDGTMLKSRYYRGLDCSAALDVRDDNPSFSAAWSRLYDEVERRWRMTEVTEDQKKVVEEIRRESFLAVSHATNQHEIACYVSDDFELMVRGRLLGLADPVLDHLWEFYGRGEFPGQESSGPSH